MLDKLMANASKSVLDIPEGIKMSGYINRKKENIGTHDNLFTKAVTIDNGQEKIVLITNDLLCIDSYIVNNVVSIINKKHDIPEENIFICASHTHSGPDICKWHMGNYEMDKKHKELKENIINVIAENALTSIENLIPAKIGFGQSICNDVASNRIDKKAVTDNLLHVIKIVDYNDRAICALINYACHPTVLGCDNLYISSDYPGVLQTLIENEYDGECVAMFINGACGNQSTRFTRRSQDFEEVERLGNILYKNSIRAIKGIKQFKNWIDLSSIKEDKKFPRKKLPSKQEALEIYNKAKKEKEKILENKDSEPFDKRIAITRYQGAKITLDNIKNFKEEKEDIVLPIQLIQLGFILIVGIPAELFVEYGLEIKETINFKNVIIAAYTNSMKGYIYTEESYKHGDYEALSSPFDIKTGEVLVKNVKKLISKL